MLAFEVGKALEQMSPDVQKPRAYQQAVINQAERRRCPVYIPLGVFYLQTFQGLAVWSHQEISVSEKQSGPSKRKS